MTVTSFQIKKASANYQFCSSSTCETWQCWHDMLLVSLVKTCINVVLAAFLQSSGIVTQKKPAVVILVHR
jgi:hypothetical protein